MSKFTEAAAHSPNCGLLGGVVDCWEGVALGAMSRLLRGLCFLVAQLVNSLWRDLSHNVGDLGSIPGSGRSPGEGNGNTLQYSYLENPMDGGAWQATVHGVSKSRTRLSDFTFSPVYMHRISVPVHQRVQFPNTDTFPCV